jgi:predicted Zn-dependent protease
MSLSQKTMSASTVTRKPRLAPAAALLLLALAAGLWGLILRGQISPARKHLEAGVDAARQQRLADAEREWREATSLAPDDSQGWNYLAELYAATQNRPAELECLHRLEGLKPPTPHLTARLAQCSLQAGDERAAYLYAQTSLQTEPDDPATLLLFCDLLAKTHENQRRLDLLRRLARLEPDSLTAQLLLATTLADKRQFDEAGPLVEQILSRAPDNSEAHSLRGMILLNTDPTPEGLRRAEADLLRAVGEPRYAAFAHFNLGKVYKLLNRPAAAVEQLEAAAQQMPTRREVWFELADACTRAGQPGRAAEARQRAEALPAKPNGN